MSAINKHLANSVHEKLQHYSAGQVAPRNRGKAVMSRLLPDSAEGEFRAGATSTIYNRRP